MAVLRTRLILCLVEASRRKPRTQETQFQLLCASSVFSASLWLLFFSIITTEAQRTQSTHGEKRTKALSCLTLTQAENPRAR